MAAVQFDIFCTASVVSIQCDLNAYGYIHMIAEQRVPAGISSVWQFVPHMFQCSGLSKLTQVCFLP